MNTATIQIGNSDDKLTQGEWAKYVRDVDTVLRRHAVIHFFGGSPNWYPWQNVAWVVVADLEILAKAQARIIEIRKKYNQDSVAWTQSDTVFI